MAPRRFTVEWSEAAFDDLHGILEFIEKDHPVASTAILERIRKAAATLDRNPNRGRVVPELAVHGIEFCREIVLAPWRILYEIRGDIVRVHMVVDSRRDLEELLIARILRKR